MKAKLLPLSWRFTFSLLMATAIWTAPVAVPARDMTIEQVAQMVADQHNANSSAMLDDLTMSSTAKAVGRNVRFETVNRFKRGLSANKIREFETELKREIIPKVCAVNKENVAFQKGLYYTFIYRNGYGEHLTTFNVDKALCKAYW